MCLSDRNEDTGFGSACVSYSVSSCFTFSLTFFYPLDVPELLAVCVTSCVSVYIHMCAYMFV